MRDLMGDRIMDIVGDLMGDELKGQVFDKEGGGRLICFRTFIYGIL